MGFPLLSKLFTALDARFGSSEIQVRRYAIETNKRLPAELLRGDGNSARIVMLSDLHCRALPGIAEMIRAQDPDCICICGDMVKRDLDTEYETAVKPLLKELPQIAPTYMSLGNHEALCPEPKRLVKEIRSCGIVLLGDGQKNAQKGVPFYGTTTSAKPCHGEQKTALKTRLKALCDEGTENTSEDVFKILLAHRPSEMDCFEEADFDLVFCGHNHGGFLRLPGKGYQGNGVGLLGPEGQIFPKYRGGLYHSVRPNCSTQMLVSEGLGGPRIGIKPEICVVEINCKQ